MGLIIKVARLQSEFSVNDVLSYDFPTKKCSKNYLRYFLSLYLWVRKSPKIIAKCPAKLPCEKSKITDQLLKERREKSIFLKFLTLTLTLTPLNYFELEFQLETFPREVFQ